VLLGRRMLDPPILSRVPGLRTVLGRLGQVAPEEGHFSALATRVQRRPWWVLAGTVVVLAVRASPALVLQRRNSTTALVAEGSDQRAFSKPLAADYPGIATPPVLVVAEASLAQVQAWAPQVAALPGVASIDPARADGEITVLGVRPDSADARGPIASVGLRAIRDLEPDFDVGSAGQAAIQIDFVGALLEGLPWAAGIVVTATLVLLFLMTGSILVPVKALIINLISLTASLGVTTWVF